MLNYNVILIYYIYANIADEQLKPNKIKPYRNEYSSDDNNEPDV